MTKKNTHNIQKYQFKRTLQQKTQTFLTYQSAQTMYAQTLQALSSKLQTANKMTLQQKRREKQEAELKLLSIETYLNEKKKRESQEIDVSKQSINALSKLCDETLKNFSIKSEKQQQLVAVLREQIESQIEKEQKDHNERVENILQESETKIHKVIEDSEKKIKTQKDRSDLMLNEVSKRLTNLQKQFKAESQTRKQNCMKITEEIEQEITMFREQIEKEKEKRRSSEKKLNGMMNEIEVKVKGEIEIQAQKRKKNNEALLKLIEVACNKLEEAMHK